jgi:type I restriction enzyme S subunit
MIRNEDNQPPLPSGWLWTKLDEVVERISNGITQKQTKNREGMPVTRIETISEGVIDLTRVGYLKDLPHEIAEKYRLSLGDILFSHINSDMHLGKTAIFDIEGCTLLHGMNLLLIRPNKQIIVPDFQNYLFNHYRSSGVFISIAQHAVNQSSINQTKMKGLLIPLAPFGEQVRIVAKLEELFARLDAGVEGLRKVKTQLKRYRQAVLKYAFEGKLTEEWRKTHKDHAEPAQKLLEQIKNERRKDPKYKEQSPIDMSELPEVPENWMWTRIGDLFDVGSGGTPSRRKPEYWKGNIPWVSSGEVAFCEIKSTKECITKEGLENSSAKFYPAGTVLMALYGEGKTRGQAAIMRITGTTNQAVACIVCANSPIPSEYVYWWLFYRYYETRRIREGANQPNMYLHHVRKMAIPVAPLSEQKEIIQKIEESLSVADEIDRTADSSLSQAERLRRCILKTAFEGGLVSQDPSDEPAETLLERIKVESTKSRGEKDTSRRKKNKPKQLELSSYVE